MKRRRSRGLGSSQDVHVERMGKSLREIRGYAAAAERYADGGNCAAAEGAMIGLTFHRGKLMAHFESIGRRGASMPVIDAYEEAERAYSRAKGNFDQRCEVRRPR